MCQPSCEVFQMNGAAPPGPIGVPAPNPLIGELVWPGEVQRAATFADLCHVGARHGEGDISNAPDVVAAAAGLGNLRCDVCSMLVPPHVTHEISSRRTGSFCGEDRLPLPDHRSCAWGARQPRWGATPASSCKSQRSRQVASVGGEGAPACLTLGPPHRRLCAGWGGAVGQWTRRRAELWRTLPMRTRPVRSPATGRSGCT